MSSELMPCPDCQGAGERDYTTTGCQHLAPMRDTCHRCDGRGKIGKPGRSLTEMIRTAPATTTNSQPGGTKRPTW